MKTVAETARPERLSLVDTAWLHMEMPTNLMMVGGVTFFDGQLERARLLTTLRERLLVHPRFVERIEPALVGPPNWVVDPDFNLEGHVRQLTLPEPGDDTALRTLLGDLMSHPLDMSRPLWDMHIIDGYVCGSALFTRFHHCIGDGTALIQVLLGLTEPSAEASMQAPRRRHAAHDPDGAGLHLPSLDPRGAARAVAGLGAQAYTLARMTMLWPDAATPLRGKLVRSKQVAWTEPYELERLRGLRAASGCTVNDILVAAITGGLRAHIRRRHGPVPAHIRALVPVDMRPDPADGRLGNQFGLVFLDMPVGIADRRARLAEVHERMDAARHSPMPSVALEVLGALGLTPQLLQRQVIRFFGSKGTAVVTNVRGPSQGFYMAGSRMRQMVFFVPQSAHLGIGISIMSYAGQVQMGVIADAGLVRDPRSITRDITTELRLLTGG